MSSIVTNQPPIEEKKPKDAAEQPLTQVATAEPEIKTTPAGIPQGLVSVVTPDPIVTPKVVQAETPKPLPVAPIVHKAVDLPKVATSEAPKAIEAIPDTATPVIKLPPPKGLDFSQTEKFIEDQKQLDTFALEKRVAAKEQADFNRLNRNATALGQDSGYTNATRMATLREANNNLFDGMNSIRSAFNSDMTKLSREKAIADADFNQEAYLEFSNAHQDQIDALLSAGDIDGAVAHAQAVGAVDDSPYWDKFNNPAYVDILKTTMNKDLADNYNTTIKDAVLTTAVNANVGDAIHMADSINSMINNWDQMPEFATQDAMTFFSSMAEDDYLDFGIDTPEDKELLEMFKDGDIDWTDRGFKEMYAEAMIRHKKKTSNIENIKLTLGEQFYEKYAGDPTGLGIIDAITEGIATGSSAVNFDGNNISNFGVPIDGGNAANAPGVDVYLQDWDFNPYVEGTDTNNFLDSQSDVYQIGDKEFTGAALNDMYTSYIKEMGRMFDAGLVSRDEVKGMRDFKNSLEDIYSSEEKTAQIKTAENESDAIRALIKGETLSGSGDGVGPGEFIDPETGKPANFSSVGLDFEDFDEVDASVLKDILGGGNVHNVSKDDWGSIDAADPRAIGKLIDAGIVKGIDKRISTWTPGAHNILDPAANPNNPLTGDEMVDLWKSLENGQGTVFIGGERFHVTGVPGRHNTSSGWIPVVNWTITGEDDHSESYRGMFPGSSGVNKSRALSDAKIILER